jgi:hypothetical protein
MSTPCCCLCVYYSRSSNSGQPKFCGFFAIKNPAQGRVFVVILQQFVAKLG